MTINDFLKTSLYLFTLSTVTQFEPSSQHGLLSARSGNHTTQHYSAWGQFPRTRHQKMHTCQIGLLGKKRRCNGTVPQNVWVIGWYGYDMINRVWITTSKAALERSQQSTLKSSDQDHVYIHEILIEPGCSIKTPSVSFDRVFFSPQVQVNLSFESVWRTQDRGPKHCAGGSAPAQIQLCNPLGQFIWVYSPKLPDKSCSVQNG